MDFVMTKIWYLMKCIQLNIVKAAIDRLIHDENHPIDWAKVDRRLQEFPWTAGIMLSYVEQHSVLFSSNL